MFLRIFIALIALVGSTAYGEPPVQLASLMVPAPRVKLEPLAVRAFRWTQADPYDNLIADAAAAWDVDPFLLKSVLWWESGFDPKAKNKRTGALGLGQFTKSGRHAVSNLRRMRGSRQGYFTATEAVDPLHAVPAAAELLSHCMQYYGRDGGIVAYNAGPGLARLVKKRGYGVASREVGNFLLRVIRVANEWRTLGGLPPLPPPVERVREDRRRIDRENS